MDVPFHCMSWMYKFQLKNIYFITNVKQWNAFPKREINFRRKQHEGYD